MKVPVIKNIPQDERISLLNEINIKLASFSAEKRVSWALEHMPINFMLSSSFGIQAAVSLHLLTCQAPDIPIVTIDTGYLFPETYHFIDELTKNMRLNLMVFRSNISPAWQEARYGKLWEQGIEGIDKYNKLNKVEPINTALKTLNIQTWFAGLRRVQSHSRANLPIVQIQNNVFKFFPIIDWNDDQVANYINKHKLQYHPLWRKGYVSVGDIHTTKILTPDISEEETRFFGLKRECGLHENTK
ncbi:phosphoadenylyl-sulfate reductase [Candidatus Ishikawella capsulata]|uniref:Phosphoadenosine 5'-phosphosulfate reductase n=1 Tax=Candidatus Ishikawaella capsulata Mpkobe TaxID=476281 RepID=C5WCD3_9ENTR|nr:phosphoadenylyl-sulfate reductase [Candidatus Ishikawaella capsulata]BAH82989.1 phosphoadenosine phosphosulfate reductase [Candidatus Ishikawaella capsulata Mpkobe]